MISTLKAMFEGRKELFKGLAIMKTKWDWKKLLTLFDKKERFTATWARKVCTRGFRARIVMWNFGHEMWYVVDFVPEI